MGEAVRYLFSKQERQKTHNEKQFWKAEEKERHGVVIPTHVLVFSAFFKEGKRCGLTQPSFFWFLILKTNPSNQQKTHKPIQQKNKNKKQQR